ncbi:hypothetical protein HDA32_002772 [Spinactinospora alkalitolerans]|uniref:Regulatory protein n=2 Tax=Spinactinospora alkalitolerans TaxID=687207 RepID=A0A852TXJ4_9ACTN|nr:hypothetical protein [Spinactinospora alkalitolerans]
MSHLCGLCLALRDDHGQMARVATNYDGLVISALVAAQSAPDAGRRAAGPCPLRGMRRAEVAEGEGARLAAAVSLMLASAKVDDHVSDGDGAYARRPVRGVARRVANRWAGQARKSGSDLGFDSGVLLSVMERQREVEEAAGPGTGVLAVTAPTEEATAQAFAHTATLARRAGNEAPLGEAGRLFGRVAHLLDAVEDQEEDRRSGAWNPITATDADVAEVRRLCDDAVLGVRLALEEADFTDGRLVHALLVHELERAVARTFARAGHPPPQGPGRDSHPSGQPQRYPRHGHPHPQRHGQVPPPQGPPLQHGHGGSHGGHHGGGGGYGGGRHHGGGGGSGGRRPYVEGNGDSCCGFDYKYPKLYDPPKRRGPLVGCGVAVFMASTCQFCCRESYPGPWSGRPYDGCCTDCSCCDCCDCNCCDCCCCD